MEKVSVVIPTYKRNKLLEEAITSVIAQTYKNIEVLIIDDNGYENEYRKQNRQLEKKFSNYSNIKFFYPSSNLGGSNARNYGIMESKGSYISFLDDDDRFFSDKIEIMLKHLLKTNTEMAYSYVVSNKGELWEKNYNGQPLFELFRDDCLAATSQWVIKKDALIDVNGFDDTPAKQDSILTYKLISQGYSVTCVPKILSIYNEHDGTRISNSGKTLIGELNLYNKYEESKHLFTKLENDELMVNFNLRIFKYKIKSKKYISSLKNLFYLILKKPNKIVELFC